MRRVLNDKKEAKRTSVVPQIKAVFNEPELKSTGFTPDLLMFGKKERLPRGKEILKGIVQQKIVDISEQSKNVLNRMKRDRRTREIRLNLKRVKAKSYNVGDKVVIANTLN